MRGFFNSLLGRGGGSRGKKIEPQFFREEPRGKLAFDAIARVVQRGSERAKTPFPWRDSHHSATYSALAGQSGFVEPIAGILVKSGSYHYGQYVLAVDGRR